MSLVQAEKEVVSIEIGGMPIAVRTDDPSFRRLIENRYAGFVGTLPSSRFQFDIDLYEPTESSAADDDLEVKLEAGEWLLRRGDFRARWNSDTGQGRDPSSVQSVCHRLRLAHRSQSHPGEAGRIPGSCRKRDSRRKSFSVLRCFGRGQDDDLSTCAARCDAADR